ncbi:MAG: DNA-directed RNA polymerase subunit beta', partial [Acutalibacteraceae bacterium]|nr:DNA-directed RNA polymerase subunit beta' [Acutalibacteraceae bacterium]
SIGEPGTQLTMRTFHTGGIASTEDITQGLPRVEELFEARRPKHCGLIAKISGRVRLVEEKKSNVIVINNEETMAEDKIVVPYGSRTLVNDGDYVNAGDLLVPGAKYPQDILEAQGPEAVQEYIIAEIQNAYRTQGVDINDKHIEVIVRQMMRKLCITDSGSTELLQNVSYEYKEIADANAAVQARIDAGEEGLTKAQYKATLLGITKASLATESFMSAASFQETTRVLTEAAIKGKVDPLFGLKENVIIGQLIPAGTGMKCPEINPVEETVDAEEISEDFEGSLVME